MEYILRTHQLTKRYRDVTAVDRIDLHIRKGDIYGFLGQNGAGKTTTLRMITGLIQPTSGAIEMFGREVTGRRQIPFERIGSIIEFPGFYPNLSAWENLELHRKLMGVPDPKTTAVTLELVGLANVRDRKFHKLSLGMKQRLGIARALLHNPELLILDEPTNGLDPNGIMEIRKLVRDLAEQRGITILISSHILSEVEQLANRIGIIHRGKLLKELYLDEIREKNRHYLQIRVGDDRKATVVLEQQCGLRDYRIHEPGLIRVYEQLGESGRINTALVQAGVEVVELSIQRDTLEDYFLKLTGGADHA
jgi:bacitracin transport system ATP-binding protein